MCGFFGIKVFGSSGYPSHEISIKRALNSVDMIRHRGPDDEGYLLGGKGEQRFSTFSGADTVSLGYLPRIEDARANQWDLFLGFRRLSIIDLSPNGHQPMLSPDGNVSIVYNGELYNFIELRQWLKDRGVSFQSASDTEVILKSYLYWGTECFSKFRGMWAICIIDARRDRIIFSRDPFGIKPFHYSLQNGYIAFGSEIKSLISYTKNNEPSPQSFYNFMTRGRTGLSDLTMYKNVFQVPASTFVVLDGLNRDFLPNEGQIPSDYVHTYWAPGGSSRSVTTLAAASEELRDKFLDSVNIHSRADVPIAVNLSGGLDSSSILGCARQLLGQDVAMRSFSFIASSERLSEEKWIDIANASFNADSTKFSPSIDEMFEDFGALLEAQDEPIGSISPYAQFCLFRCVGQSGVKVTLDGQGADEYLAGYNGYLLVYLTELIAKGHLLRANKFAKLAAKRFPNGYLDLLLSSLNQNRIWSNNNYNNKNNSVSFPNYFLRDYVAESKISNPKSFFPSSDSFLNENLKFTLSHSSLPELLRFADRNSMYHSVESRVPFLDKDLVDFCLSLPSEYLISQKSETKYIFKRAMKGILPDQLRLRKDKIGFTVPEKNWLLSKVDYVDSIIDSFLNRLPINRLEVKMRWNMMKDKNAPYDPVVWRAISLGIWAEKNDIHF